MTNNALGQTQRWLDLVYPPGVVGDERLHVGVLLADGQWYGNGWHRDQVAQAIANAEATSPTGVYLGACTYRPDAGNGRKSADTARCYGMWSDLDITGPGHKHDPSKYDGLTLPPNEESARKIVAGSGLPQPTTWVHSGGGLYAWWLLDTPTAAQGCKDLARQWQAALARTAAAFGWHYGTGVSDLARVLRIPGTINRKEGLTRPCRILSTDGPRYTIDQLRNHAAEVTPAGPTRAASTDLFVAPAALVRDRAPGESSPLDDFNARATWGEILEPYGWAHRFTDHNGAEVWLRPGGTSGRSADCGGSEHPNGMKVWSDSAGLPTEGTLTKAFVWAALHQGKPHPDMKQAVKNLAAAGYGTPRPASNPVAEQNANIAGILGPSDEPAIEVKPVTAYRTHDDIGNGNRLFDLHGHRFRYVADKCVWRMWDGRRWDLDWHGRIQEAAKHVTDHMGTTEREQLIAEAGDEPTAPEGYPGAVVGPLAQWLAEDPVAVTAWLAEAPSRLEWAGCWLKWYRENTNADSLKKFTKKCRDMPRITAMVKAASSIPQMATRHAAFDLPGAGLLNVCNGTLDTNTVTLRPHSQTDMLTRLAPVNYNPDATAPLWEKFLLDNLPDIDAQGRNLGGADTRRYLQKLAGYALTGRANEKMMAYLYGPSDTGKSLFAAVLLAMLGPEYGVAAAKGVLAPRGSGDDGRDPDRHDMAGARLVTTSESRPGETMDEALVKALTGRDAQRTRGNYAKGNHSWTPEMLLMVCSNQLPRITGDDDAIWTRIKVIPFNVQFLAGDPRRDDQLQTKIVANELDGVLAWAVEGLRMYLAEGLADCAAVRMATEKFRSDSDGVARFLSEGAEDGKILVAENEWSERTALYSAYTNWCSQAGVKFPLARDRFYTRMEHLGYVQRKREGKRGIAGIRILQQGGWFVASPPF